MKDGLSARTANGLFVLCISLVGVCIFAGVLVSFRTAGGAFADAAGFVTNISFEETAFSASYKRALVSDLIFCVAVLVFGAGFPLSVLPGGYILFKGFLLGVTAGLAARCCVMKDAVSIFFAIFISNFLVLPLYILLFLAALGFSYRACGLAAGDKMRGYLGFSIKVPVFFALMCAAEFIQIGTGVLVLK